MQLRAPDAGAVENSTDTPKQTSSFFQGVLLTAIFIWPHAVAISYYAFLEDHLQSSTTNKVNF